MTRILLVYPQFPRHTYWSFSATMPFLGTRAAMPPLGLITVAAMLPPDCELRLVDMNIEPLFDAHLQWADLVMTSTMIVQAPSLEEVLRRARAVGVPTVVGGPHPSSIPDSLSLADHILIGEAESILAEFLADWRAGGARRIYRAETWPEISTTPPPRFDLLRMEAYASLSVQYSRGCPFACEFCDIWKLYGRRSRTKDTSRWLAELEALHATGWRGSVFVVDDNFIGRPAEVKRMLAALAEWQRQRGYPFQLFTEASVNVAQDPELLALLQQAGFSSLFLGIETPSDESLRSANKGQNLRVDLLESVRRIHAAGIEVMGGFIVGFDQDGPDIFDRQIAFIQKAGIPVAMVGILTALPGTELHHRLVREGRMLEASTGNNTHAFTANFRTRMDPGVLSEGYRRILHTLYAPNLRRYFERCRTLLDRLGPNALFQRPVRWAELKILLRTLRRLPSQPYAAAFSRFLLWALVRHPARIAEAVRLGLVGHHFQEITAGAVERHHLTSEMEAALESHIPGRLRTFGRRLKRLPSEFVEECLPLYRRMLARWEAKSGEPAPSESHPSMRLNRLREWVQEEMEALRMRCHILHQEATLGNRAFKHRLRRLQRERSRLLRNLRRQIRALPREYQLLAQSEYRRARARLEEMIAARIAPLSSPA